MTRGIVAKLDNRHPVAPFTSLAPTKSQRIGRTLLKILAQRPFEAVRTMTMDNDQ